MTFSKGGDDMEPFEKLFAETRGAVQRFVKYRMPYPDAQDVLQEVYITAYQKFGQLKDTSSFKAWMIGIARNKCNDYFRQKARMLEVPIDTVPEAGLSCGRMGISEIYTVRETLGKLASKDKEILYLYYWIQLSQAEIAKRLGIPLGTVKSRLWQAKQRFKKEYPYHTDNEKGCKAMKKMPISMPDYTITERKETPFTVKCEELPNWFIIPRIGESVTWSSYNGETGRIMDTYESKVTMKTLIHGLEAVEIKTLTEEYTDERTLSSEHLYYAQLTDTHCRWLGESYISDGVKYMRTFLDGDEFLEDWGFGEDNCGTETEYRSKGIISRTGRDLASACKKHLFDVVGCYTVKLGERKYDTILAVEIIDGNLLTERYVDQNGYVVLCRRFNRDNWVWRCYGKKWSEKYPNAETITVNGEAYVHWYDSISDYVVK